MSDIEAEFTNVNTMDDEKDIQNENTSDVEETEKEREKRLKKEAKKAKKEAKKAKKEAKKAKKDKKDKKDKNVEKEEKVEESDKDLPETYSDNSNHESDNESEHLAEIEDKKSEDAVNDSENEEKKGKKKSEATLFKEKTLSDFEEYVSKNGKDKLSDNFSGPIIDFCLNEIAIRDLERTLSTLKRHRRTLGSILMKSHKKEVKKEEREKSGIKKGRAGFDKTYPVPSDLYEVLVDPDFSSFVEESTPKKDVKAFDPDEGDDAEISGTQLAQACMLYGASVHDEDKKLVDITDEESPVGRIFSQFLEDLNYPNRVPLKYQPSDKTKKADKTALGRSQMISYSSKYLSYRQSLLNSSE
jgi:hypothetical protein